MPKTYAEAIKQGKFEKSIYKFFLSFMVLSDYDVKMRIGSSEYEFPKRRIRISDRFWRADGCYRTGKCCSKVSMELFLSSEEFAKLVQLYPEPGQLQPWQAMQIQLIQKDERFERHSAPTVWTSIGGKDCPYLSNDGSTDGWKGGAIAGCNIHELNPIHCALPHLYFDLKNTKKPVEHQYVNITKRQFGRNWAFGCPVTFIQYNEFARKRDLLLLNRVRDLLIEFTGTADRVSDIIKVVEERELLPDPDLLPVV